MRKTLPKRAVLVPLQAKRVFKGIIYDTYHWQKEMYDGSLATFEMLKRPDTVKIIAIDDNKLVILEQTQPHEGLFYDVPGGRHDHEDEDELTAAKRELLEETGMKFRDWKLLSVVQPSSKIEQFIYTFLATDLASQSKQRLDGGEKIKVQLVSFNKAKELLSSPMGRFLPKEIEQNDNLEALLALPEHPRL